MGLVFAFVGLDVSNTVRSGAGSAVGSVCGILSSSFIGNILPSRLLEIFSLALRNNPMLFKNDPFSTGFIQE